MIKWIDNLLWLLLRQLGPTVYCHTLSQNNTMIVHRVEVKCCACSQLNCRVAWVLGSIGVSSLEKNIIGGSGDSFPF